MPRRGMGEQPTHRLLCGWDHGMFPIGPQQRPTSWRRRSEQPFWRFKKLILLHFLWSVRMGRHGGWAFIFTTVTQSRLSPKQCMAVHVEWGLWPSRVWRWHQCSQLEQLGVVYMQWGVYMQSS